MKQFIFKLLSLSLVGFIAINIFGYMIFKLNYFSGLMENSHIYISLFKSQKEHSETEVFVFGDSVANQMYYCGDYNDSINSLCTNMSLTFAGQYMLIRSICEYNDMNNKTVVLLFTPTALSSELDNNSSVHYFLKPFYNNAYNPFFDDYLETRIETPFIASLTQLPMIKLSNYYNASGNISFFSEPSYTNQYYSETSQHYLNKIEQLSKDYGFILKLLPTLQNESKKEDISHIKEYVNQLPNSGLFTDYFSQIIYRDSSYFQEDGTHFKQQKLSEYNILDL